MRKYNFGTPTFRVAGRRFLRSAFGLALAGPAACADYPSVPAEPQWVIHGLLVADSSRQEIIVERTRSIAEGYYKAITPAVGARVTATRGGETFRFVEDPKNPGVFRASFVPRAGERYRLRVEGDGGRLATGETVIPGTPRFLVPTADTAVATTQRFPVAWTSSPSAGYVLVPRKLDQDAPSDPVRLIFRAVRPDTVTSWMLSWDVAVGERLSVAAVDSSYLVYAGHSENGFPAEPPTPLRTTLRGGYGVFGSVAYSNPRRIRVVR